MRGDRPLATCGIGTTMSANRPFATDQDQLSSLRTDGKSAPADGILHFCPAGAPFWNGIHVLLIAAFAPKGERGRR